MHTARGADPSSGPSSGIFPCISNNGCTRHTRLRGAIGFHFDGQPCLRVDQGLSTPHLRLSLIGYPTALSDVPTRRRKASGKSLGVAWVACAGDGPLGHTFSLLECCRMFEPRSPRYFDIGDHPRYHSVVQPKNRYFICKRSSGVDWGERCGWSRPTFGFVGDETHAQSESR